MTRRINTIAGVGTVGDLLISKMLCWLRNSGRHSILRKLWKTPDFREYPMHGDIYSRRSSRHKSLRCSQAKNRGSSLPHPFPFSSRRFPAVYDAITRVHESMKNETSSPSLSMTVAITDAVIVFIPGITRACSHCQVAHLNTKSATQFIQNFDVTVGPSKEPVGMNA